MLKKVSGSAIAIAIAVGWAMPAQAQDDTSTQAEIAQMRAEMQAMAARIDTLQAQLDAAKSQADAAASTANQAATTATAANQAAAAATETATAAKASSDKSGALASAAKWAADTKISGRMYFNISSITANDAAGNNVKKGGGFEFKRFYVGIDHKFNDVLSGNITTDVTSANGSGAQLYVKKAYLRANFSKALDVRLGATDMPWIPYVEGIYGHRYVENTLTDMDHFGTSSDWGVHVQGKLADGLVNYQVSATNGAGYKTIKMTKAIDLEGRLAFSYHGFNAAIGGHTGKLGKDDGTNVNLKTANRFDALLAYKGKISAVPFTIGGEYFHATNWNNVTGAISPTMDISSEGYSIFASVKPVDKFGIFGRYDWVKPDKELAPTQVNHYFNLGVEYSPAKIVDIALVYKRDSGDNGVKIGHLGTGQATRDEVGIFSRFRW